MSLFAPARPTPGTLVSFRAGKMMYDGIHVTPDIRKGTLTLFQEPGTGLIHLTWKERTASAPEEDLMIFPQDAKFSKVEKCTTGRVFLLEFEATKKRHFFWSQEPKDDKDNEYVQKINEFINNPPTPGAEHAGIDVTGGASSGSSAPSSAPAGGASTAVAGAAPALGSNVQLSELQSILRGLGMPQPEGGAAPATAAQAQAGLNLAALLAAQQQAASGPDLADVLAPEALVPYLSDERVRAALIPLLPEELRTAGELPQSTRSPQFRQTLDAMSRVLQSPQGGDFMTSLGLNPVHAIHGVEGFVRAVQERAEREQQGSAAAPATPATPAAAPAAEAKKEEGAPAKAEDAGKKDEGQGDKKQDGEGGSGGSAMDTSQ
eukprot:tig00020592_g11687.t1